MEIIHGHPLDMDRSQASLREEYNQLLNKVSSVRFVELELLKNDTVNVFVQIESLADAKDEEEEQLEDHMQEIKDKKKLLQNEINRLQSEMNNFKAQICNEPLHAVNPKAISQKVHSHT